MVRLALVIVSLCFAHLAFAQNAQDVPPEQPAADVEQPATAPEQPAPPPPPKVFAPPPPAKAETPVTPAKEEPKDEKPAAPVPGDTLASLGNLITIYGRMRLDYSFDTSRAYGGATWAYWVLPNYEGQVGKREFKNNNDYESNISARNSRFGMKLKGTHIETIKADLSGQLELDFNGGDLTVDTWKALPRMRIAAFTLDWGFVEIMGGNNWDTFSTLYPMGDLNIAHAFGGNVGFRRPQLRLSFKPSFGEGGRVWIQMGIARPLDIANSDYDGMGQAPTETDKNGDGVIQAKDEFGRDTGEVVAPVVGDGNNDGEDSGIPMLQWRLAVESPIWTKTPFMIGTGGHYQKASFNTPIVYKEEERDSLNSYHVDMELVFPIIDELLLRGEFFYGQMLKDITGAIAQDVNPETGEAIKAMGGWVDLIAKPFKVWNIAIGYTADKPDADTMEVEKAANMEKLRYMNSTVFVNNIFDFGSGFTMYVTYVHMMTDYRIAKDSESAKSYKSYTATNERFLISPAYNF